jgi:hypothetical protein
MTYTLDKTAMKKRKGSDLKTHLLKHIQDAPQNNVWTPSDFVGLGSRSAVDKALQRLATSGELRRIDRGLYDRPRRNELTGKPTVPDYRAVIQAVARRDNARILLDGMTAANDLGLTTAVPARIEVFVDARLRPIRLGNQVIHFKTAAASRLFWAGRPAMRIVQALYWMQDIVSKPNERQKAMQQLRKLFADPNRGPTIRDDLQKGFSALPIWMQEFVTELIRRPQPGTDSNAGNA